MDEWSVEMDRDEFPGILLPGPVDANAPSCKLAAALADRIGDALRPPLSVRAASSIALGTVMTGTPDMRSAQMASCSCIRLQ